MATAPSSSWGADTLGELGGGVVEASQPTPAAVPGLTGVTAISAGTDDSAALLDAGSVMTWGTNASGVLGAGSPLGLSDVPVPVLGLSKVASVSAGRSQMLAFGEPIPTVAGVSPRYGSSAGGTSVTITGTALAGASGVRFGSTPAASFTVSSPSSITAVAPAGGGTVDVTVTTPSGTSPPSASDRFTFQHEPTVTKLSLKSGSVAGGSQVTITGTEFSAASAVSFGGASAPQFTVLSPTSISAVAPAGAAGKADVTVTNTAGTGAASSRDRFTYLPVVEGVTPASGPPAGGTTVTVTGRGFAAGATAFKFGAVKAKIVNCASGTSCEVTAPAQAAGTVDVTATVNKATSAIAAPADRFTYG